MDELETALQGTSSQIQIQTSGIPSGGSSLPAGAAGNFLNMQMFLPSTLKYSGVSLMTLDTHINKVEKWLNVAFEDKPVPDNWYVLGFSNTLEDEFKSHLSNQNIYDIKTKKT